MDPNAAWEKAVEAADRFGEVEATLPESVDRAVGMGVPASLATAEVLESALELARELAEAVLDLNEWLVKGGFPPVGVPHVACTPEDELEAAAARVAHPTGREADTAP